MTDINVRLKVVRASDDAPINPASEETLAAVRDRLDTLKTYTDGLEALLGSSNTNTDATRAAIVTLQAYVDQLEGYTDTLESLLGTTNTNTEATRAAIVTLQGFIDDLEGALTTLNAKDFATQATLALLQTRADLLATEATLSAFKAEQKTESDETQLELAALKARVRASQTLVFSDTVTVWTTPVEVAPPAGGLVERNVLVHLSPDALAAIHINAGAEATQRTLPIQPGGSWKGNTNQAISAVVDGIAAATSTTPDSSSFGHDGLLEGTVLPASVASPWAGFGNALEFDGVDRDDLSSGVNLGASQDFALRGQTGASYESHERGLAPATLLRMNETTGDMLDQMPAQPYLPKLQSVIAGSNFPASVYSHWRLGEAAGNFADSGPAAFAGVPSGALTRAVASVITPAQTGGDLALAGAGSVDFGQNHKMLGRQSFSVVWWVSQTTINLGGDVGRSIGIGTSPNSWLLSASRLNELAALRIARVSSAQVAEQLVIPFDYTLHPRLLVVGTYDGATLSLYAQGQLLGTVQSVVELLTHANPLSLTLDAATSKSDELSILPDVVLTPAQVQELFTYGTSKIGACNGVVTGNVTRNAPGLVTPNQNNPFGDVNGALSVNDATALVNFGNEAYRMAGKQPFALVERVKVALNSNHYLSTESFTGSVPNRDLKIYGWRTLINRSAIGDAVYFQRFKGVPSSVDPIFQHPIVMPASGIISLAFNYTGSVLEIYVEGALVVSAADSSEMAINVGNFRSFGGGTRDIDELAIFLRALTAAEIAALHTSATVWDGGTPRTIDYRVKPTVLQNAVVHARENVSTLDWSAEITSAGAHKFRYRNAANAVETLQGGAYAALSLEVMRVIDDRTAVTLYELIAGVPTQLALSYARPNPDVAAVECYAGRNAKTVDVGQINGVLDERRQSKSVRTDAGAAPYVNDADTLALLHFDTVTTIVPDPPPSVKVFVVIGSSDA